MATHPKSRARENTTKSGASPYRMPPGPQATKWIDAYVNRSAANLKQAAQAVRRLVKQAVPGAREAINPWGIPTFDYHGPLCFMMVGKHHVTFGFPRGTSLSDPAGLLEGTGKNLRHVKVVEAAQLQDAKLRELLRESAALNRKTPLTPSMRVKKTN